jgi:hypothetical protein
MTTRWKRQERDARIANGFEWPARGVIQSMTMVSPLGSAVFTPPPPGWNQALVEEAFIAGRRDRRR